ncbi:hypothetical protein BO221_28125 [Archangium sp. Cb G35]|uniref:hypothetical protein n=1 Tax=Archangium sp. Cb G35 TaxID=1920190 RepID=UPI0009379EA0|nr:hypothetical protein [Archangium sp. Cb G35]OJT20783.1 hypothetical protein BO221_28125 [Archangium sp. Cb G35]
MQEMTPHEVRANLSLSLTARQQELIYQAGYPRAYSDSLGRFYEEFGQMAGDPIFGSDGFNAFLDFVGAVKPISSPTSDAVSALTRAMYFEISNLKLKEESIEAIADCLTNRVIAKMAGDYMSVGNGLNGLNPSMKLTYFHRIMKNPIADCYWQSEARRGLMKAYTTAYVMMLNEWGEYPFSNRTPEQYHRFSSLPKGYLFFNETPRAGRLKIGSFYFRKNF